MPEMAQNRVPNGLAAVVFSNEMQPNCIITGSDYVRNRCFRMFCDAHTALYTYLDGLAQCFVAVK
jgi:hypothetical protein